MRIHTHLTSLEISRIAHATPGVEIAHIKRHGSRKRKNGIEIHLWGTSSHRTMSGDGYAATWDEWGYFIERVFRADPYAIVGRYPDYDTFEWVTQWRFEDDDFTPKPAHSHRWNFVYAYNFECKCGATMTTEPFLSH